MSEKARPAHDVLANLPTLLVDLESVYKDIHSHPELSMHENRTAGIAADRLRAAGYEVMTGIGTTGVVGVFRNGDRPTIMLRADMDALPVREATGLPYASTVTDTDHKGKSVPAMHACGHDMHVSWLIGAATLFARSRDAWKGALGNRCGRASDQRWIVQALPKTERHTGQHVMVGASGAIGTRSGVITSAGDSLQIRMFGRGARELAPTDAAVVTVGSLQAGTKENVS